MKKINKKLEEGELSDKNALNIQKNEIKDNIPNPEKSLNKEMLKTLGHLRIIDNHLRKNWKNLGFFKNNFNWYYKQYKNQVRKQALKSKTGSLYFGGVQNGNAAGIGVKIKTIKKELYIGEFNRNYNGEGILIDSGGNLRIGQFINGKLSRGRHCLASENWDYFDVYPKQKPIRYNFDGTESEANNVEIEESFEKEVKN